MSEGNSSKTWLFVGLGCGALALIGACVGGAAFFFLFRAGTETLSGPVAIAGPSPVLPAGYRPVTGPNWSFGVPPDWTDVALPPPVIASARTPIPLNGFHTNVNLVTEPFFGDATAYGASNVTTLQAYGTQVVAQTPVMVGALSGLDVEAQWPQNVPPTHTIQRFTASNGTGYAFTCSGPLGNFETVRQQCNEILATFSVQ
jgi:hypothetical protein